MSFFSLSRLLNLWFDLPWPWGAYDRALPPEHKGPEIFRPGSRWVDSCSRLPCLKVNNTPAVTPSRDRITSMRLAAGKLRSEIQFVCVCMVLWCFCPMCKICSSLLKPVCCLKRAEFQLQLQISLKGRAFMFLLSDRAAHYSLLVAFVAHKKKTHFLFLIKSGTVASSYLVFLLSVCSYQSLTSLQSLCFFVIFVVGVLFFWLDQLRWMRHKKWMGME